MYPKLFSSRKINLNLEATPIIKLKEKEKQKKAL
jgi:hypothetical protein